MYFEKIIKYLDFIDLNIFMPLAGKIPTFLYSVIIFFISFILLAVEYDGLKHLIKFIISNDIYIKIQYIKDMIVSIMAQYIQCQLCIFIFNFFVLLICFTLLNIYRPLFMSLLACILDMFPVIGIGVILIPLIIIEFIECHYLNCFYIGLIYLFLVIIREIIEPIFMNRKYNVSFYILFISAIIHLTLFGIYGLILSYFHVYLFYMYLENKTGKS